MRQGLFEAAAERYSEAIDLLGDSDAVAQERKVCFSNRASPSTCSFSSRSILAAW